MENGSYFQLLGLCLFTLLQCYYLNILQWLTFKEQKKKYTLGICRKTKTCIHFWGKNIITEMIMNIYKIKGKLPKIGFKSESNDSED